MLLEFVYEIWLFLLIFFHVLVINQDYSLVVLSRFLWDTLSWHILPGCIDLNPMLCTWKQSIRSLGKSKKNDEKLRLITKVFDNI